MNWRSWWEAAVELVFPGVTLCGFCLKEIRDDPWRGICGKCTGTVLETSARLGACPRCGFFSVVSPCPNCRDWGDYLSRVIAVAPYEGLYREMIYFLKYGGRKELAVPLGYLMAEKARITGLHQSARLIVPIPLHPDRKRERGYNQSALLAVTIGRVLGLPAACVLRRTHDEKKQAGLGRQARKANLEGSFAVISGTKITGSAILLVDDIVTTGATLAAAACCLRENGAGPIFGLTWAAGADHKILSLRQEGK